MERSLTSQRLTEDGALGKGSPCHGLELHKGRPGALHPISSQDGLCSSSRSCLPPLGPRIKGD